MLDKVVVLNLSALITHQVDAAFWHEWSLFGIPGGIQFFDVFNFFLFWLLLTGLPAIVKRQPSGLRWSLLIAATSAAVLPIHAGFALAGHEEFHLPVSVLAIVATFLFSLWQAVLTVRCRAEFQAA